MFKALYVCLGVVKKRFIRDCRKFLWFDDYFLFGPNSGSSYVLLVKISTMAYIQYLMLGKGFRSLEYGLLN